MSKPTNDDEKEIARLHESSLAKELIESRKELLKCQEALFYEEKNPSEQGKNRV